MTTTEESVSLWQPDVLGHGYECMDLPLKPDEEGPVKATLVRHAPPAAHPSPQGVLDFLASFTRRKRRAAPADPAGAPRVVLYLHGWADYFLQTELAEYLTASGFHFYAAGPAEVRPQPAAAGKRPATHPTSASTTKTLRPR